MGYNSLNENGPRRLLFLNTLSPMIELIGKV